MSESQVTIRPDSLRESRSDLARESSQPTHEPRRVSGRLFIEGFRGPLGMVCIKAGRRLLFLATMTCVIVMIAWGSAPSYCETASSGSSKDVPRKLSLKQAVAIALGRNYKIVNAGLEVRKKERERRAAYSDFFPNIEVEYSASLNRYEDVNTLEYLSYGQESRWYYRETPTGYIEPAKPHGIDPYKTMTLTATLTQPLFSGGKLLNNYRYARLGVRSAQIQLDLDKQDLILEVYRAYYRLVLGHKLLATANKSVRALRADKMQSEAFYRSGLVLEVDVLATEGQLAKALTSRRNAEKYIKQYEARLNFLLRYPQNSRIRVIENTKYEPNSYRIPEIYNVAVANRLEIAKADISTEQALAMVKVAEAGLMPTVDVEVQGSKLNDDWNVLDPESYGTWTVRGVLTWTFDMFGYREKVKKQRVAHAQEFVARQQLVEQIMEEVQQAYLNMSQAEGNIFDHEKQLKANVASYRHNSALYKEQLATYREVLDAEKDAAQAAADYYTSLMNYKINKATLERRMGILR